MSDYMILFFFICTPNFILVGYYLLFKQQNSSYGHNFKGFFQKKKNEIKMFYDEIVISLRILIFCKCGRYK